MFQEAGLSVRYYTGSAAPTRGLLSFSDCAGLNICANLHKSIKMAFCLAGVLRWFKSMLSNGFLEGITFLMKAGKAKARGYRTLRNLIAVAYLRAIADRKSESFPPARKRADLGVRPPCFLLVGARRFELRVPPAALAAHAHPAAPDRSGRSASSAWATCAPLPIGSPNLSPRQGKGRTWGSALRASYWSAREDSNFRPLPPQGSALPGCATRREHLILGPPTREVKNRIRS